MGCIPWAVEVSGDRKGSLRSLSECGGHRLLLYKGVLRGRDTELVCLATLEWAGEDVNVLGVIPWNGIRYAVQGMTQPDPVEIVAWKRKPDAYWESLLAFGVPAIWIDAVEDDGEVTFQWGYIEP